MLLKKCFAVDYININIEVHSFILIETIKAARDIKSLASQKTRKLNIYGSFYCSTLDKRTLGVRH